MIPVPRLNQQSIVSDDPILQRNVRTKWQSPHEVNKVKYNQVYKKSQRNNKELKSYSHWLIYECEEKAIPSSVFMMSPRRHTVVNVSIDGIPSKPQSISLQQTKSSLLRHLCIRSPLRVTNVLACDIEIIMASSETSLRQQQSTKDQINGRYGDERDEYPMILRQGESHDCLSFHSSQMIHGSIRFVYDNQMKSKWSTTFIIQECDTNNTTANKTMSYYADIMDENNATLTITVEVADNHGCRSCDIFTPYWLISTIRESKLIYQHDPATLVQLKHNPSSETRDKYSSDYVELKDYNGTDELAANQFYSFSSSYLKHDQSHENNRIIPISDFKLVNQMDNEYYNVVHFCYTDPIRKLTHIRMKSSLSKWSSSIGLDMNSAITVRLQSYNKYTTQRYYQTLRYYDYVLQPQPLPKPYHRTQAFLIQPQYYFHNLSNFDIEICQFGNDEIIELNSKQFFPFSWFQNSKNFIQIRYFVNQKRQNENSTLKDDMNSNNNDRIWYWSSKILITNINKKFPLILFNNNNDVLFLYIQVKNDNKRIVVEFHNYEEKNPFFIENKTNLKLKLNQTNSFHYDDVSILDAGYMCGYVWPDHSGIHSLDIEVINSRKAFALLGMITFSIWLNMPIKSPLLLNTLT
jgi:hypothetical protein